MIKRLFTENGKNPYDSVDWRKRDVTVFSGGTRKVIKGVQFPTSFSQTQRSIATDKYFKIKKIPHRANEDVSKIGTVPYHTLTWKQDLTSQKEVSFKQLVHRISGAWAYSGWKLGYFTEQQSQVFYDQCVHMLINQMFAPNSPQWFNTGVSWAYGIEMLEPGYFYVESNSNLSDKPFVQQYRFQKNGDINFSRQQVSACYIHKLEDSLLGQQSITDMLTTQTRLFRNGSGNGFNASSLRSSGQGLSNGGNTSGMMSFLKVFDKNADVVKSGGRTRRSARNRVVNVDHPEIQNFLDWKVKEEQKIRRLVTGSKNIKKCLKKIYDATLSGNSRKDEIVERLVYSVEPNLIQKTIDFAKQKIPFEFSQFNTDFNGEATKTVSGQNANNNIRTDASFMHRVLEDKQHELIRRTTKQVLKTIKAKLLLNKIAKSRWTVGDPGLYYIDNTNAWNTCADTQQIRSANPCQQYLNLDNTSCNLVSLNLMKFKKGKEDFNVQKFCHAIEVVYLAADISISISISPSKSVALGTYNYRPIGMGFMNLGAMLMSMAIPYDSQKGQAWGRTISAILTGVSYKKSIRVRAKLGAFPKYKQNRKSVSRVLNNHYNLLKGQRTLDGVQNVNIQINYSLVPKHMYDLAMKTWKKVAEQQLQFGVRNNALTCIRPTGTIGLMMDSAGTLSSEPDYKLIKQKKTSQGRYIKMTAGYVESRLLYLQYTDAQIKQISDYISKNQTMEGAPYIKSEHLPIFDCAVPAPKGTRYISIDGHLNMMSAINGFISMGISKTVNVPAEMTIQQVYKLFIKGWKLGLKALTIYRDNCRLDSPMKGKTYRFLKDIDVNKVKEQYRGRSFVKPMRKKLPMRRKGWTQEAAINGHKVYLRTGQYEDGSLGQIFIDIYKQGSFARTAVNLLAKLSSKCLQYGIPMQQVFDVFLNVNQQPKGMVKHPNIKMAQSLFDLIGRVLAYRYAGRSDLVHNPDRQEQVKEQGIQKKIQVNDEQFLGKQCENCGSYNMVKNGTCFVCKDCGTTSGCS